MKNLYLFFLFVLIGYSPVIYSQIQFEEISNSSFDGVRFGSSAFSDVDGDGDMDVLNTGQNSLNQRIAKLYINDGSGNFAEDTSVPFDGVRLGSIAFSDVDGDGDYDVLITGENSSNQRIAKLYINDGSGNFTEDTTVPFDGVYFGSSAFSDVDGDGDSDILITGSNNSNQRIAKLYINDGTGSFSEDINAPFDGVERSAIAFSDVDGDGDEDVLITGLKAGSDIAKLYLNDSNGNFTEDTSASFEGVYGSSVAFSDVDGDGDQDVLITGFSLQSNQRISKLYINDSNGNFTENASSNFIGVNGSSIAFSDVDGDGDQDVLITGYNNSIQTIAKLYENDGTGNFSEATSAVFDGIVSGSVAFSDIDIDGDQDVLITGRNISNQGTAKLYRNLTGNIYWGGSISSEWSNTNNWQPNEIPQNNTIVHIPNALNQPLISASENIQVSSLTTQQNAEVQVHGTLKVNSTITNNGQITFKSDATSTGQFDEFTGTYSGSGTVEIERFIPAGDNQKRAFRFLTSSVTTPTSIRASWQEGVNNTSTGLSNNLNPSPGFGTHISGSLAGENGFDATLSGNPSLFLFDNLNQTWNAIPNTDASILETGKAYRLFIRGDRSIDLTSNASTPTNTTLRAKGELSIGPVDMTSELAQNAEEFSFLGNPYQSIVNFGALNFGGGIKSNFLYIWNPNLATRGAYETIDLSTNPSQAMLQLGQSFFVQNSTTITTPPSLEFTEASKFTEGNVSEVFSEEETAKANLVLMNVQNEKRDEVKLRLERGASNAVDDFDAGKLGNETENLAFLNGNKFLAVERRDLPSPEELLPLFINQYQNTDYQFSLHLEEWDQNIKVFLLDNYLNTETLLAPEMPYSFSIDAIISESLAEDRFILKLKNTTLGGLDKPNINNFLLYPNPTQDGQFSIQTNFEAGTQVNVKIFNVMGQEVMNLRSKVNPSQDLNINANQLSNGVYIVDIVHENQSYNAKLVID